MFLLSAVLLSSVSIAQQAWTQPKGFVYSQVGVSLFNYDTKYNIHSDPESIPREIVQNIISAYSEYGLRDNLTVGLNVPFQMVKSGEINANYVGFLPDRGELNALGNVSTWLNYRIYNKHSISSTVKLEYSANTSSSITSAGLRSGFDAASVTPSFLVGYGYSRFFTSAEIGYRILTNDYLDRILVNAQLGVKLLPKDRVILIFGLAMSNSIGSETESIDGNNRFTALYQNQQSYTSTNFKVGVNLNSNFSLWFANATGTAKNVGRSTISSFAVAYKFSVERDDVTQVP